MFGDSNGLLPGLIKMISWLPFWGEFNLKCSTVFIQTIKIKSTSLKISFICFFSPKFERLALGKLMCHPLVELNGSIYSS